MKQMKQYIVACVLLSLAASCKKDNSLPSGGVSLTVVNAVAGSEPLIPNFSEDYTLPGYYLYAQQLPFGYYNSSTNEVGLKAGITPLMLYQYPDTLPKSNPLYNIKLDLSFGLIYTLYLTGSVASPDTMMTVDNPNYYPLGDSSIGIRFVNLSPGSSPVNVTLSSTPDIIEESNIGYKNITGFKTYPAVKAVASYTFQFRDPSTNLVLGSVVMNGVNNGSGTNTATNRYRYRNFTIALIGEPSSQRAFLINNY